MQDIRKTYFLECAELMEELIDELEVLCAGQHDPETINTIFRSIHSIKGGAGAFGFATLVRFAHGFENVLDAMRSGRFLADGTVCQMFIKAADVLGLTPKHTSTSAALLIDTDSDQRFALQVESIEDQRQVVIKGLHCATRQSAGVSAATILGNGRVSFIIDPIALLDASKSSAYVLAEPAA